MKIHADHRVPLSDRCIEILQGAKALSDCTGYVFPGRRRGEPLSNGTFDRALERLGRKDITTHGMRSAFRDWAEECTHFSRAVCEAALAHSLGNKTEVAYLRTDLFDQRRQLMAEWSAFATGHQASKP
jgi:integrase